MVYNYVHWYPPNELLYLTDEQKVERAKEEAARSLAKELLRYATYGLDDDGRAWVRFEF